MTGDSVALLASWGGAARDARVKLEKFAKDNAAKLIANRK
jgi:hypothetical protein